MGEKFEKKNVTKVLEVLGAKVRLDGVPPRAPTRDDLQLIANLSLRSLGNRRFDWWEDDTTGECYVKATGRRSKYIYISPNKNATS